MTWRWSRGFSDFCLRLPATGTSIKTGVKRISVRYDKNAARRIEGPRKNVRSFATFPSKFPATNAGKFRRCRKRESKRIPAEDPGGAKFSDVARLFVVRPFVPARWKCWPATKLRNSRESVAEGRVAGSSKEQNREEGTEGRGMRGGRRGRCRAVFGLHGEYGGCAREGAVDGSASKWGNLMYMHATPGSAGWPELP